MKSRPENACLDGFHPSTPKIRGASSGRRERGREKEYGCGSLGERDRGRQGYQGPPFLAVSVAGHRPGPSLKSFCVVDRGSAPWPASQSPPAKLFEGTSTSCHYK